MLHLGLILLLLSGRALGSTSSARLASHESTIGSHRSLQDGCDPNPFATEGYPEYFSLARSGPYLETQDCNFPTENEPPFLPTVASMIEKCKAFCPPASVPALLGLPVFGLEFSEAAEAIAKLTDPAVENVLKDFSRTQYQQCLEDRNAFHAIKEYGATFVKQLEEFDAAVLLYRKQVKDTIDFAKVELESDEHKVAVQRATGDKETMEVYATLYKNAIASNTAGGRTTMEGKLNLLSDAAGDLRTSVGAELQSARAFVSQCAQKMWPHSDGKALLDLCTVKGTQCFHKPEAEHVSCGCLVNLATEVGVQVDSSTILQGRRLQSTSPDSIDVCASARQQAGAYVQSVVTQLGSSAILSDREAELKAKYGDAYCGGWSQRRLHELPPIEVATVPDGRMLQESVPPPPPPPTCQTNPFANEGYPSFFELIREKESGVESCTLSPGGAYQSTDKMVARCEEFCPANSIPVLLGSSTFGLSFTQAVETLAEIMSPTIVNQTSSSNSLLRFDLGEYETCQENAKSFLAIKKIGAKFVRQLFEFEAAVLAYRSATMDTAKQATTKLNSSETYGEIDRASGNAAKVAVVIRLYQAALELSEVDAQAEMKGKLNDLEQATEELKSSLDTQMVKANAFLSSSCADKWWPPQDGSALLDICRITGTPCINADEAKHATCGCLVNLATEVGVESGTTTTADGRRLQTTITSNASAMDLCAQARMDARPYINNVTQKIGSAGNNKVITDHNAAMTAQYGSDYCSMYTPSPPSAPPPSPPPSPPPPSPPPPSPPPPSPPPTPRRRGGGGMDGGAIAAIVITLLVVLCCGGCCFYFKPWRQVTTQTTSATLDKV